VKYVTLSPAIPSLPVPADRTGEEDPLSTHRLSAIGPLHENGTISQLQNIQAGLCQNSPHGGHGPALTEAADAETRGAGGGVGPALQGGRVGRWLGRVGRVWRWLRRVGRVGRWLGRVGRVWRWLGRVGRVWRWLGRVGRVWRWLGRVGRVGRWLGRVLHAV
jgi:hypothetical protein